MGATSIGAGETLGAAARAERAERLESEEEAPERLVDGRRVFDIASDVGTCRTLPDVSDTSEFPAEGGGYATLAGTAPARQLETHQVEDWRLIRRTMSRRDVLFVIDPPETFNPRADSTHVMVTEALRRGLQPFGTLVSDLSLHGDRARARVRALTLPKDSERITWDGAPTWRELSEFGAVLMRKDPPVDAAFVAATWILDHAHTLVLNAPAGLRDINEKLAIANFPHLTPRTFVSRNTEELRELLRELGGRMIAKPVYGFGGREILLLREDDPNLGTLLELATADGTRFTVAQEYLPAAKEGDKRILLVDGEFLGAVLRVPARGELRNNFHAGGTPASSPLNEAEQTICAEVGPWLRERGQFFVGIDVIGGRLTEINVTSPTGMQEINRLEGLSGEDTMEARFWKVLETKLGGGPRT